jgi:hypothetical protein
MLSLKNNQLFVLTLLIFVPALKAMEVQNLDQQIEAMKQKYNDFGIIVANTFVSFPSADTENLTLPPLNISDENVVALEKECRRLLKELTALVDGRSKMIGSNELIIFDESNEYTFSDQTKVYSPKYSRRRFEKLKIVSKDLAQAANKPPRKKRRKS